MMLSTTGIARRSVDDSMIVDRGSVNDSRILLVWGRSQ